MTFEFPRMNHFYDWLKGDCSTAFISSVLKRSKKCCVWFNWEVTSQDWKLDQFWPLCVWDTEWGEKHGCLSFVTFSKQVNVMLILCVSKCKYIQHNSFQGATLFTADTVSSHFDSKYVELMGEEILPTFQIGIPSFLSFFFSMGEAKLQVLVEWSKSIKWQRFTYSWSKSIDDRHLKIYLWEE